MPEAVRRLYQQFPVATGHDSTGYNQLLAEITAAVGPQDVIEAIWTKDVVDQVWEVQQLRRIRAKLLEPQDGARRDAIDLDGLCFREQLAVVKANVLLAPVASAGRRSNHSMFATKAAARSAEASPTTPKDPDEISAAWAAAYLENSVELERISRMIAQADARRDACLREIESRRARLAGKLRQAAEEIIEAEFTESGTRRTG